MLNSQARRFGDTLVERRVLGRDEIDAALDGATQSGSSLAAHLVATHDVPATDLAAAWAAALQVPFVDLRTEVPRRDAMMLLPPELASTHRVMPVRVEDDGVVVAFPAPLDNAAVDAVSRYLSDAGGPALQVAIAEGAALDHLLQRAPGAALTVELAPGDDALADLYRLFDRTLQLGGSDLHLAAHLPPFVRSVGELVRMPDEPELSPAQVRRLVYSILSHQQQERFEQDLEIDLSHAMGDKVRFRVNVFVQRNAVGAAFRVIPADVVAFEHLGVPEIIRGWADLPRGLVLITGPTGSGKSTTLAALVDIVNQTRAVHIMTIEDPVEFVHKPKQALVNQREVGEDTHGFGRALTQAMRQDPDVILVGEMRDLATIATAITAAETGHLVFGTLHTQGAPQTVDRIIDVFPAEQQGQVRIQLANSLVGVSTQQLVPTADGRSRVVATEVMIANTAIRALIRDGKIHQIHNAMASGKRQGMQSMDESLAGLVRQGTVTAAAALRRAQNPDELSRMLGIQPGT